MGSSTLLKGDLDVPTPNSRRIPNAMAGFGLNNLG